MNPLRLWNTCWFGPISARPLGAFRIVFGLVMLANLAFLAYDLDHWLTDAGLLRGDEARMIAGPLRFSVLHSVQDPTSVRIYFAVTAVVTLLLTIGWQTRLMSILFYLAMLSIHHRNIVTASGADTLVSIIAFYVMLSPCGAAFSLDARRAARRRGTLAEPLILPWAQRLIQFHISLIYFDTAVLKCNGATWLNGTALHYVLNNTEVGWFQLEPLTQYPLAINVLTHGAILIEFALAFLLWFRATRAWVIVAGLVLHTGIHVMVNIPIFGELMTACYITFLQPDELDAVLRACNPRNWFRRTRPASASIAVSVPAGRVEVPGRIDPPSHPHGPHYGEIARLQGVRQVREGDSDR